MESQRTDRRRFLQLCGTGVAIAVAGCLDGLGGGGDSGSVSLYADALVAENGEAVNIDMGLIFGVGTRWRPAREHPVDVRYHNKGPLIRVRR